MKRSVFAIGLLALGIAAATPARADYAVVRFDTGYCQIWWDGSATADAQSGVMATLVQLTRAERSVRAQTMVVFFGMQ